MSLHAGYQPQGCSWGVQRVGCYCGPLGGPKVWHSKQPLVRLADGVQEAIYRILGPLQLSEIRIQQRAKDRSKPSLWPLFSCFLVEWLAQTKSLQVIIKYIDDSVMAPLIFIIQMRKLRLKKLMCNSHGHIPAKQQARFQTQAFINSKPMLLIL